MIDPNMQALMKLYPLPNADPNATGGYNYVQAQIFNQNNHQWLTRVDYNISDNTKLFVRYNMQRETQPFPVGLWWRKANQVPYPTPVEGKNRSDSVTATLTHVFSPTMTNEFVFAYTFIGFPNVFAGSVEGGPRPTSDTATRAYSRTRRADSVVRRQWRRREAALIFNPGGFEAGGASSGLYANKYMPSVSDTRHQSVGTHTIKAGVFYE